jgi:hypothetical protein
MNTPLVSLAIIVGPNEGELVARLIKCTAGLWDEVVCVSACGKNDAQGVRICAQEAAGEALVWGEYHNAPENADWPHIDHFAAARNKAFSLATGKYVLWFDADDLLDPGQAKLHRDAVLAREQAKEGWEILVTRYDVQNSGMRDNRRERIFRRQPDGRLPAIWERAVHERVKPVPGLAVGLADHLVVIHAPNTCKKNSSERNKRILGTLLQHTGMNLYYLAQEGFLRGAYQESIGPTLLGLEHPDLGETERYQLYCMAGVMCADHNKRRKYLGRGITLCPTRREAYGHLAAVLIEEGNFSEAVRLLNLVEMLPRPQGVIWNLDAKWYGHLPKMLIEQCLRAVGQTADADRCVRESFRQNWGQITMVFNGPFVDCFRLHRFFMDTSDNPAAIQALFITDPGTDIAGKRIHIVKDAEEATAKALGRILLFVKCAPDTVCPSLRWDVDLLTQDILPAAAVRLPDPVDRKGNVIVGLTTTPTRIGKILPTIQSLLAQSRPADQIILSVPEKLARTGERFGDIPKELQALADAGKLEIHRTKDYGPATKFIGPLEVGGDPDDKICWLDDDILYSPLLLQTLAEELDTRPKTALGVCGFFMTGATGYAIAPDHGGHAEILEGFGGVMCRRSDMPKADLWPAIPASEFAGLSPVARAKFLADDYMMSTELRKAGTATLVCNTPELNRGNCLKIRPEGLGADALQNNKGTGGNLAAYALLKANG